MVKGWYIVIESNTLSSICQTRNFDALLIEYVMIKSQTVDTTVTVAGRIFSSVSLGTTVLVLRIIVESARLEEWRVTQHALREGGLKVTQTNGATRDKKILCYKRKKRNLDKPFI